MAEVQHYYTVGKHGAPTPETAPHGYKWRLSGPWICSGGPYEWHPENQWWPLPAPPTEQAPPPEPVARWTSHYDNRGMWVLLCERSPNFTKDEAAHILKTLNALDRDGVAWGPGRPMSELPDGHRKRVLLVDPSGHTWIDSGTHRGFDEKAMRAGWWPLPLPGEAQ